MNRQTAHTDVGAYALGLLEDHDRRAFEVHLAHCRSCAAELGGLSRMRELLAGVEPEPVASDELIDVLRRRRTPIRPPAPNRILLAAAAGFVLIAGGVTAGLTLGDRPPAATQSIMAQGEHRSGTDPATGARGTVALISHGWGTWVALDLSNVRGPLNCELVAVNASGGKHVVTGWAVPAKGYGVPGSPGHLTVEGGVADPLADIVRFEVRVSDGSNLLTIPV